MKKYQIVILAAVGGMLSACGGGSGGGSSGGNSGGGGGGGGGTSIPTSNVKLSGNAATGLALANATVSIKCATGTVTTNTNSSGAYSIILPDAALPCVLKVTSLDGLTILHSVAAGSGAGTVVANITPLTELVVGQATGQTPATFFNNFTSAQSSVISASNMATAVTVTGQALSSAVSIGTLNPLTDTLVPATASNPTGNAYDLLLDQLKMSIANAQTTLAAVTQVLASGSSATVGSALQSQQAVDFAAGLFSLQNDSGTWAMFKVNAAGAPVNGTYSLTENRYLNANGVWGIRSTDPFDDLTLTSSGWQTRASTISAILTQTGSSAFYFTRPGRAPQNITLQSATPTTVDWAGIGAPYWSGTPVIFPLGSKSFTVTFTSAADEYILNGGSGFGGIATTADFRNRYAFGNSYLTVQSEHLFPSANLLSWQFGSGTTGGTLYLFSNDPNCINNCSHVAASANGTWNIVTVQGVEIMLLTIPTTVGPNGSSTARKLLYAVIPGGNVQEGIFSPSGVTDEPSTVYNRLAMDAILLAVGGLPIAP